MAVQPERIAILNSSPEVPSVGGGLAQWANFYSMLSSGILPLNSPPELLECRARGARLQLYKVLWWEKQLQGD